MSAVPGWFPVLPAWLVAQSVQAGILVVVVLAVQGLCRGRLRPRWRYTLWWFVLLRLLLPVTPESSFSVFNVFPSASREQTSAAWRAAAPDPLRLVPEEPASATPSPAPGSVLPRVSAPTAGSPRVENPLPSPEAAAPSPSFPWAQAATGLWAVVAAGLMAGLAIRALRFRRDLNRDHRVVTGPVLEEFERCRRMARVQVQVALVETRLVAGPALFGLWRPCLLLPPGLVERFSAPGLRYIFLHELAHLRRHDLWIGWLVAVLQAVHWFNPLLWLGFRRLRVDREPACDELALTFSGDATGKQYGEAVLALLDQLHTAAPVPGGVAIVEDRAELRDRIRLIARFRRRSLWSLPAMILMAAVGVVALTDARSPQLPARIPPADGQSRQAGKAPASRDTPEWSIQGRVLDRRTGRPLPRFRISVGSFTPLGRFEWDEARGYQDREGRFVIRVSKTVPSPALRVDADGYLPAGGGVLEQDQTSLEFSLEAGVGPLGHIVGHDGEPVREATVALIGPGVEAVHVDGAGRLTASGWKETVCETAADGGFAFKPQLEPLHLLAWSRTGFRLVSSDELKRKPEVRLRPWGQLQGSLRGPSGPLANAKLVLVAAGALIPHVTSLGETVSDADGRFKFERVPAIPVEVHLADPEEFQMLAEAQVSEGETRSVDLQARPLPRSSAARPPALPFPKRIEGEKLRGVVLSPAGRPVEKAEVAFVVPGRFLSLGRFRFEDNLREISLLDVTDAQGRFTLPLCEGLESIMAVGREGFLRTSLEAVRRSNTVRLEPWATIQGTLPGPGMLDSDRVVRLQRRSAWSFGARLAEQHGLAIPAEDSGPGIELSLPDYLAHVDSAGRFTFPFVPAGAYVILDAIPLGSRSSMWRTLAEVRAASGQTVRIAPGAGHRSVRARVRLEGRPPDWAGKDVRVSLYQGLSPVERARWNLSTNRDSLASLFARPQYREALAGVLNFPGTVGADGTVRLTGVRPGTYELAVTVRDAPSLRLRDHASGRTTYGVARPVVVPPEPRGRGETAGTEVDLGTLDLEWAESSPATWE